MMAHAASRLASALVMAALVAGPSFGCAYELPVTRTEQREQMELESLRELVWPRGQEAYRLLTQAELEALERLVATLYERAERGSLTVLQHSRVSADAELAGVELHDIELELDGTREHLWVIVEPADDRRGRGAYLFRLGELEGPDAASRVEHVLQAPHSYFDEHSGEIALGMFVEPGAAVAPARALLLNTVHRHLQFDGERRKREEPGDNPADAAHRPDHPLARATARLLTEQRIALIQLHGFERNAEEEEADVIVSAGQKTVRPASSGVVERLEADVAGFSISHFGEPGAERLGGTSNVQAKAAREAHRCFVHVEMSARLRERLREDGELRRSFAAGLLGGAAEEFRDGCS